MSRERMFSVIIVIIEDKKMIWCTQSLNNLYPGYVYIILVFENYQLKEWMLAKNYLWDVKEEFMTLSRIAIAIWCCQEFQ